jgi:hypothetical protein
VIDPINADEISPIPVPLTTPIVENKENSCWKRAYGRGIGKPIHNCRAEEEKSGLLCYPPCKDGYTGVGPVCWQNCPSNFRNDGSFCAKPKAYGRGYGSF